MFALLNKENKIFTKFELRLKITHANIFLQTFRPVSFHHFHFIYIYFVVICCIVKMFNLLNCLTIIFVICLYSRLWFLFFWHAKIYQNFSKRKSFSSFPFFSPLVSHWVYEGDFDELLQKKKKRNGYAVVCTVCFPEIIFSNSLNE